MANLITKTDFGAFRDVSLNIDDKRVDPYIAEAQEFDIKPVLGPAFYLDFINNFPDGGKYDDLFNGKDYTDKSLQLLVSFKGVKAALVYYSYARLLLNQDMHVTASGLVEKDNQYAKNVEGARVQRQVTAARLAAGAHEKDYISFLNNDPALYPIWLKECQLITGSKAGINISRVTTSGTMRSPGNRGRCYNCNRFHRYCVC